MNKRGSGQPPAIAAQSNYCQIPAYLPAPDLFDFDNDPRDITPRSSECEDQGATFNGNDYSWETEDEDFRRRRSSLLEKIQSLKEDVAQFADEEEQLHHNEDDRPEATVEWQPRNDFDEEVG